MRKFAARRVRLRTGELSRVLVGRRPVRPARSIFSVSSVQVRSRPTEPAQVAAAVWRENLNLN